MILNAGLAVADTDASGSVPRAGGGGHTLTRPPTGEGTRPPVTTKPPVSTKPATTSPPGTHRPTTEPPTTTRPPSSTRPPTTPPSTTGRPGTTSSSPRPSTTAPPTTRIEVATALQITFDARGRGTIWFTVTNDTDKAQPARDVYAYSTGRLRITSVAGCSAAPALRDPGPAWATSFKCSPGSLRPHETKRWSASVEYPPAVAGSPRAARAEVRLPLAPETDLSTFCVLVVPEGAADTSVILGRAGPLTLVGRADNNDPSFIGYTVDTPLPSFPGGTSGGSTGAGTSGGGTSGGSTGGGSTGGGSTAGTNTGGATDGTTPGDTDRTPPSTLPKTGPDDDTLSLAGGAVGLLLVGNALFQGARLRRIHSAEDEEPEQEQD
ncbi:hypothetical protein B4N89_21170 [Embleya scabrispora]|uniref:Uncharacterized protein n=1 Tax=Embleya scabrispora TaxID=159449 RepID=A0A1T3P1Z6_9ACTN|nr:hypothetical protein [Embleya scabrispora]OPC83113.1 hypothetical protein B4N89_21170 [Embleya scabrispora]